VNKIVKWSAVIIISGLVGLGIWWVVMITVSSLYSNPGMPLWEQIGEIKEGETQIKPGESFSVSINLVKESRPELSFRYTDTVNTDCTTKTFETDEFLSMQILDPNKDVIVEADAEVTNPFYVCALNLKEGTRDLGVLAYSGMFKVETEGVYTMIISNTKDVPIDISYRLFDNLGRMVRGN